MSAALIVLAALATTGWYAAWTTWERADRFRIDRDHADKCADRAYRLLREARRDRDRLADELRATDRELVAARRATVRVAEHAERVRS